MSENDTVKSFRITPEGTVLEALSPSEIDGLFLEEDKKLHDLLERCTLAVLNSGQESDDVKTMLERYSHFSMELKRTPAGVEIELYNAPASAFVTYGPAGHGKGSIKIIEGMRQHIFAVLRDLIFIRSEIERTGKFDLSSSAGITDAVFLILRNAGIFSKTGRHKTVVCWGGHSIPEDEYEYTKEVGYQLGLRLADVITGCGPGAMKGPMKGAAVAHSKQRVKDGRYIGITEPGIIASEAPNPIVDPLVIMPDIEKRLEAFLRIGQGIIIFPGGAGTTEEFMYILGVLLCEENREVPFPLVLTGPDRSAAYFQALDDFVEHTLGEKARSLYTIITGDPVRVALEINKGLLEVKAHRDHTGDSYYFNRGLCIPSIFQEPWQPTHESVAEMEVMPDSSPYLYAARLRRLFSSIVWANVKPEGIEAVEKNGPLGIKGDGKVLERIDKLLSSFIDQGRMRLVGEYKASYRVGQ